MYVYIMDHLLNLNHSYREAIALSVFKVVFSLKLTSIAVFEPAGHAQTSALLHYALFH